MESKWRQVAKFLFIAFFIATWLLMCGANVSRFFDAWFSFGPDDVARRVTAPDWSRTAILVRSYGFDLNFKLYVIERKSGGGSANDFGKGEAVWWSRDYEPTTHRNWNEEIEWSKDSSVIAVSVEGQYAFAYDFIADQKIEEPESIRSLLDLRSKVTPTITP